MGVLYVVADEHTGRSYAVKTVKPSQAGDEAIVSGFIDQARIWIDLDRHEHLVQALWLETDSAEMPYLFLEFVDGPDLERLLIDGALPLPRCLDLAMQFAAGMAYAHAKPLQTGVGLVHRDLKPSNLLLGPGDVLKVADFGLAKIFKPRSGAPRSGEGGGTLAYMAPEQLRSAETIDGRADVYAFGLVLYEMLSGANPLRADNIQDQIQRVLAHTPPLLTDVPPAVEALVARCIAKDPDERPRDFLEVLGHLAAASRGVEYAWHIDPESVAPPRAGLAAAATEPHLRPRRPRVGQPFAVEIEVHGDLGPGPVDVTWQLPEFPGLRVLSPGRRARQLVEAGGGVRLNLRVQAVGDAEGTFEIPPSWLELAGPTRRQRVEVAATSVEVAYTFQLPLLGRDQEQARVERLLVRATNRESSALLVTGETGSGKSRLLVAAERRAAERGLRVVEAHADERGFRPMRLVHDAARELLGVPHGDVKHRAAARRIAATVRGLLGDDDAGSRR